MDDAALMIALSQKFQKMSPEEQSQAVEAMMSMVPPEVLEQIGQEEDTQDDESENDLSRTIDIVGDGNANTGGQTG